MKKIVEVKELAKKYRDNPILDRISFTIYRGNFISIIGPNGCGKSTLANIIAGLDKPTSGSVRKLKGLKIGFVFQHYRESLLPWRNVYSNISLPLEISSRHDSGKVDRIIKELDLICHKDKFPHQLSGGLSQLTAIARALVDSPDLLILDEPFKSLDFDVAQHIIRLVLRYCERNSITTILISHDLDQAVLFADRVIVFSKAPAAIKEIIDIKMPRPRQLGLCQDEMFFRSKKIVMGAFRR